MDVYTSELAVHEAVVIQKSHELLMQSQDVA